MKKEIFIVLGNHITGKSVTIRGLTGKYNQGGCGIETTNGDIINIYVLISALQEAKLMPDQAVQKYAKQEKLLFPLHFTGGRMYPGALDYIEAFINAGFVVSQIVSLGNDPDAIEVIQNAVPQLPEIRLIHTFEKIKDMPNNHTAHQIRKIWNWR